MGKRTRQLTQEKWKCPDCGYLGVMAPHSRLAVVRDHRVSNQGVRHDTVKLELQKCGVVRWEHVIKAKVVAWNQAAKRAAKLARAA